MRNIPKLTVFEPCDPVSLKKLVTKAAYHQGCTYMRLHRKPVQVIYSEDEPFELGKGKILKDGNAVTLIATGAIMVHEALRAAEMLEGEGISTAVIDMHTVKPIDAELVIRYAQKTGLIITCENHQIMNGLGSAVAETLAENHPCRLKRIGVEDEFGEVGTQEYLLEKFKLTAKHIIDTVKHINKWKE
jgi:transketolase